MKAAKFIRNRVSQQLSKNGVEYTFKRPEKDKYHQPTGVILEMSVLGLYHETNSYISQTGSEGSVTTSKPVPMILCLWENAEKIKNGDNVSIGPNLYSVTGVSNVQNYSVVGDISLELRL